MNQFEYEILLLLDPVSQYSSNHLHDSLIAERGQKRFGTAWPGKAHRGSYPKICRALGTLRKYHFVTRSGPPSRWGYWHITEEGRSFVESYLKAQ